MFLTLCTLCLFKNDPLFCSLGQTKLQSAALSYYNNSFFPLEGMLKYPYPLSGEIKKNCPKLK